MFPLIHAASTIVITRMKAASEDFLLVRDLPKKEQSRRDFGKELAYERD